MDPPPAPSPAGIADPRRRRARCCWDGRILLGGCRYGARVVPVDPFFFLIGLTYGADVV